MKMSNQEAIEIIELARAQIEWDYPIDYAVAFDIAISAIKAQDLQPTCNQLATDTISKKAAIDALCRRCDLAAEDDEPCTEKCNDIKILEKLPSAQLELSMEIQEILNYLDTTLHPIVSPDNWNVYAELHDMVSKLPSAQPEIIFCKNCKWSDWYYADDGHRYYYCMETGASGRTADDYCSYAEKENR